MRGGTLTPDFAPLHPGYCLLASLSIGGTALRAFAHLAISEHLMAHFHPAALATRRKYWTRHDAWGFAAPGTPEAKMPGWLDPSATRVRLQEAQEDEAAAAFAAELAEFRASHERVRQMLAEVKHELAWRQLCRKYGSNPNQPRVPRGNPDGGQWTSDGGSSAPSSPIVSASDRSAESSGQTLSDASPDPIRPGAQYAQSRVQVHESALTGEEDIDKTTYALAKRLENIVNALPEGSGTAYGILVHEILKLSVRLYPIPGVKVEPTFGGTGIYGSRGSVRPDISLENLVGDTRAYYEYKTGDAAVRPSYPDKVRRAADVGPSIYFIEISYPRGVARKSRHLVSIAGCINGY
jgi:hypothetical protein